MSTYQITTILKEEKDKEKIKKVIEKEGGEVLSEGTLGKQRFAYPIKKQTEGFYHNYFFEILPDKIITLTKKLRLDEEILRFMITTTKPRKEITITQKPIALPKRKPEILKPKKEEMEEKERLKKLEEKLEEILKE